MTGGSGEVGLRGDAPLLDVRGLTVEFPTLEGAVRAVRGVDFTLAPGDVLAIVGESGSGKSVTALAVMGLLPKTARVGGSARYHGVELVTMPDRSMARLRGQDIAMVFQDPMTSLNPVHRVGAQIAEAIRSHHDVSRRDAHGQAVALLDRVGIPRAEERSRDYPHEFSGGMRQRVVIAMAIANDPEIIIADEPTTALDVTVQAQILDTLAEARQTTGAAMVLITHDLGVVAGTANHVMVMYAGRPVEVGSVEDIFYRPRMPYTVGLLGAVPRLDDPGGGRLVPVPGSPPSLINLPAGCPFSARCPLVSAECLETEPELRPVGPSHQAACHHRDQVAGLAAASLGIQPAAPDDQRFAPEGSR
jgi:oligopeptide/dipeptide ABC transporter ATP-binding protein